MNFLLLERLILYFCKRYKPKLIRELINLLQNQEHRVTKHNISKADFEKYKRQIVLNEVGSDGQLKISNAKVLVIGAGGLSCPALQYLVSAGVGNIGIIDHDVISLSNLHRQILYGPDDLNKSKAIIASEKLKKLNPELTILPYNFKLDRSNALKLIEKYDLVVDGSDSFATRYLVNDACVILNKAFVFGAIYKFMGQLSVFNYNHGPTYRCAFPETPEKNDIPNCSTIGVLGSLTGIIGSMQANEALKIILENPDVLSGKLMQLNTLNYDFDLIDIEKDLKASKISELGSYGDDSCEIKEVKNISSKELKQLLNSEKKPLIYNLSYSKSQEKTIESAIDVDTEELLLGNISLPEDKMIIIICEYGIQSENIAEYLQNTYQKNNIYSLKDGMLGWRSEH